MDIYKVFLLKLVEEKNAAVLYKIKPEFIIDNRYRKIYEDLINNYNKGLWMSKEDLNALYADINWDYKSDVGIDSVMAQVVNLWCLGRLRKVFADNAKNNANAYEIISGLKKDILKIDSQLNDYQNIAEDIMSNIDLKWYQSVSQREAFKTIWPTFNNVLGGIYCGKLYTILGKFKVGKTFLLVRMAYDIWSEYNTDIIFCSAEMDTDELKTRFMSLASKIPYDYFTKLSLDKTQWVNQYNATIDYFKTMRGKFYTISKENCTVSNLERVIKSSKAKVAFVDSLYLMGVDEDEYKRVNYVCRELTRICKEYGVAIVTTSQFNREGSKASGKSADQASTVAYSMNIVRLSDVVIGVYSSKLGGKVLLYIDILLSRYSMADVMFPIEFDLQNMSFQEYKGYIPDAEMVKINGKVKSEFEAITAK